MPSSVGSQGFPAWPLAPPRMLMPSFSPGALWIQSSRRPGGGGSLRTSRTSSRQGRSRALTASWCVASLLFSVCPLRVVLQANPSTHPWGWFFVSGCDTPRAQVWAGCCHIHAHQALWGETKEGAGTRWGDSRPGAWSTLLGRDPAGGLRAASGLPEVRAPGGPVQEVLGDAGQEQAKTTSMTQKEPPAAIRPP